MANDEKKNIERQNKREREKMKKETIKNIEETESILKEMSKRKTSIEKIRISIQTDNILSDKYYDAYLFAIEYINGEGGFNIQSSKNGKITISDLDYIDNLLNRAIIKTNSRLQYLLKYQEQLLFLSNQ